MAISANFLKNRMNTGFVAYQNRKILLFYYLNTIYGILKILYIQFNKDKRSYRICDGSFYLYSKSVKGIDIIVKNVEER